jgi:hypothetical protein
VPIPHRAQVAQQAIGRRDRACAPHARAASSATAALASSQQAEQDDEQQRHLLVGAPGAQRLIHARASVAIRPGAAPSPRRGRGPERRACLRPGASWIGAPKVTVHRMGTGTTSPLGMTRCTLSIQAGISCTSGNCSARWYSPLLNGCGSPLLLRVPSGKITSESPLRSASIQRLQRVLVVGALARHVHRVEDLARDPVLEAAWPSSSRARRWAVVARSSRGSAAQISTQSRWLWWLAK